MTLDAQLTDHRAMYPYWLRDTGHAWLAVSLEDYPGLLDLPGLAPTIEKHLHGLVGYAGPVVIDGTAYLEEDDEARAFIEEYGLPPTVPVVDIDSFVAFCAERGEVNARRAFRV